MAKYREISIRVLMVAVSVCVTLLFIDFLVFKLFYSKTAKYPQHMYQLDDTRGYSLAPNFRGEIIKATRTPVKTNGNGYRDIEWTFGKEFRILVVGDSFTFGTGMEMEKGFVHKIRNKVAGRAAIYNAGVGGYGPPHILGTIIKECRVLKPRHIFYMYFFNDLRWDKVDVSATTVVNGYLASRLTNYGKTEISKSELRKKADGHNHQKAVSWSFASTLALINLRRFTSERSIHPRQIIERLFSDNIVSDSYKIRYMSTNDSRSYAPENIVRAKDIIQKMDEASRQCGARFTMVLLPSYAESYYGFMEPATKRLMNKLSTTEISVLVLHDKTEPGVNLVLDGDAHYSEAGTEFVANKFEEYLKEQYPELR
jgi:hypothetical protein